MTKVLTIAATNLRRFLRDRSNIFFVFIFPIGLVFILGLSFGGGGSASLGVVTSEGMVSQRLMESLEARAGLKVVRVTTEQVLRDRVERGVHSAGLLVPEGADVVVAEGGVAKLTFMTVASGAGTQLQLPVMAAMGEVSERLRAAQFVAPRAQVAFGDALSLVDELAREAPDVQVRREWLGEHSLGPQVGTFDLGAASQLVLFMFLIALAASGALIQSRKLGVSRRMLSTPTSVLAIVAGEALGRYGVALFQGAYIMLATWALLGVNWGDPLGAVALLAMFGAVAAGAGLLMGALFHNDQQAGGIAVLLGLGLAALGGAMVPLELFGSTMRSVAMLTPHAWAVDGFGVLVRHGGSLFDVLPQLLVLAGFAAALLALSTWRLRIALTRGSS